MNASMQAVSLKKTQLAPKQEKELERLHKAGTERAENTLWGWGGIASGEGTRTMPRIIDVAAQWPDLRLQSRCEQAWQ